MLPLLFFSVLIGIGAGHYECPNNVTCLEKETCCETNIGLWSCCPIENGICCNDGLHCCPKTSKCSSDGKCLSSTNEISFASPLRFNENHLKTAPCPDGSVCGDGQTCCELSSGHYACCPHPDAVCCSDHIHCCPKDHACDLEHGHCKRKVRQLNNILCPDGETACPKDFTCCQLETGGYGCCPSPDAVCCSDHLHCCPHGATCDLEHRRCVGEVSIPWLRKIPALQRKQKLTEIVNQHEKKLSQLENSSKSAGDKICPDALTLCPSGSTCCLQPNQTYGCCPIDNAVCCADGKHCCPAHYKCDLHIFKCDHDVHGSIPMLKKKQAQKMISSKIQSSVKSSSSLSTIVCPDTNLCPDETTCCELANNTYGCCPYEDGNCCSDRIHCCGNGYVCADGGDRCIRRFNSFSSSKRSLIKKRENEMKNLIKYRSQEDQLCPDGKSKCPSNSTCCPNKNSNEISYSCCPYSKGVCCGSNGSVCCPNNYDCNEEQLSCQLRDSIFLRKLLQETDYYQCDSSEVYCSLDQTCCSTYGTSDDPFACCPYPNGQCCSDGTHCCPLGRVCDNGSGQCL